MMKFPIQDILSPEESREWIRKHFHPTGFVCPACDEALENAHEFRKTRESELTVYRCNACGQAYNLYTGTIFQQCHLTPQQVVLLIRGVLKGEPSTILSDELEINYRTVLDLRREIQDNARELRPETALPDEQTESDEMFQNAGEKRNPPPPCR